MYGLYDEHTRFFVQDSKNQIVKFERDRMVFYQRNLFQFSGFAQRFRIKPVWDMLIGQNIKLP